MANLGVEARLAGRDLEYPYPIVNVSQGSRKAEFEPIGEDAVTQVLGTESKKIDVKGHCYIRTANFIDNLDRGETVRFRSWRGDGRILVLDTTTTREGGWGGMKEFDENRKFTYTINATEAEPGSWTPNV